MCASARPAMDSDASVNNILIRVLLKECLIVSVFQGWDQEVVIRYGSDGRLALRSFRCEEIRRSLSVDEAKSSALPSSFRQS